MKTELHELIDELNKFNEEIIMQYCVEMGDSLDCCRFCGAGDCIIVRTIEALEKAAARIPDGGVDFDYGAED